MLRRTVMAAAPWGLVVWMACAAPVRAATLDPAMLPKIQAATFEVVQAKPTADPLSYEKPLPLDLLPYQERTDKYYSIGTAFAIGPNRYVTAGHVLMAGLGSLWGPPALRDAAGHVYPIDKIEKFSLRKDFVVFSLVGQPGEATLQPNTRPALNQVVYAVGNALGTGVVIRDGLYTSDTPEEQDGSWKWMRFSAAASPGNSGGPLLDQDGKVIGVVLMKSPNENLNYGLPIREVLDAPEGQAVIDARAFYQLDIFQPTQNGVFKTQFALPLGLADFFRTFQSHADAFSREQLHALLAKEAPNLFPAGKGSTRLLVQPTPIYAFPTLIVRGSDGEWDRNGRASQRYTLSANGYLDVGAVSRNVLLHLRRPDDMDPARFYGDATARMDLVTSAGLFERKVASEAIKITSFGKPLRETVHVDRWQRPWQVEVWPLPHLNALVLVYSLPVPDGSIMLSRIAPAAQEHDNQLDLDELTDFVYVTYAGTLAQWKEFLKQPVPLPAVFRDIRLDIDYGHRFAYRSPRLSFAFTPQIQAVAPDNLLQLGLRFFMDQGKPVWDVGLVQIWKDSSEDDQNHIDVQRFVPPPDGLDSDLTSRWQKVAGRQYPYNGVARQENDLMMINAVVAPQGASGTSPTALYSAFYGVQGAQPQDTMKSRLDLLLKDLRVTEH
ncbi:S1 family peptidase [Fulvimonas yonginensis]|uniref:Serine protease n=1 Tax=Fulvimonas yonginensis TaxID=1495200 RepID=A0ABU8JBY0_9GAMM